MDISIYEMEPDVVIEESKVIDVILEGELSSITINQKGGVIEKIINWDEITNIPMIIGIIPAGSILDKCIIEIAETSTFGTVLEIGTIDALGLISTVNDTMLSFQTDYLIQKPLKFEFDSEVTVNFPNGIPTQGKFRIIINYI